MKPNAPKLKPNSEHVYHHEFANGLTAKLTLPSCQCEWSQKPTAALVPEYMAWRRTVLADFTARTGKRVLVIDLR